MTDRTNKTPGLVSTEQTENERRISELLAELTQAQDALQLSQRHLAAIEESLGGKRNA